MNMNTSKWIDFTIISIFWYECLTCLFKWWIQLLKQEVEFNNSKFSCSVTQYFGLKQVKNMKLDYLMLFLSSPKTLVFYLTKIAKEYLKYSTCNKVFSLKKSSQKHLNNSNGSHQCLFCNRAFNCISSLCACIVGSTMFGCLYAYMHAYSK